VSTIAFGERLSKVDQHWRLEADGLTGLETTLFEKVIGIKNRVERFLLSRGSFWERMYWSRPWVQELRSFSLNAQGFDLVICNEWDSVPAVRFGLADGVPIILDCHEYSPGETQGGFIRYLQSKVSAKWTIPTFKRVPSAFTFAGQAVANLYRDSFDLEGVVIKNVSRDNPGLPKNSVSKRVAYVGRAEPNRGIELILESAKSAPQIDWILYLISGSSSQYKKILQSKAESFRNLDVVFDLDHEELINELGSHSGVGLAIYPQSSTNNSASLPNKFFDYISAGLAIIFSPTPDMNDINQIFKVGVPLVRETPECLISTLEQLSQEGQLEKLKWGSRSAANEFNWNKESKKLIGLAQVISLEGRKGAN
jgi:glycosyltransferase involved in cell wall biosynthesis